MECLREHTIGDTPTITEPGEGLFPTEYHEIDEPGPGLRVMNNLHCIRPGKKALRQLTRSGITRAVFDASYKRGTAHSVGMLNTTFRHDSFDCPGDVLTKARMLFWIIVEKYGWFSIYFGTWQFSEIKAWQIQSEVD